MPISNTLPENRLLEKYMVDAFFNLDEINGLSVVNLGLREIVQSSQKPLDAIVLVHLIEAITCEMVYHSHAAYSVSQNRLSGLILPYSWARLLAKQYADSEIVRDTSSLELFLEVVSTISDGLDERHNNRWSIGQESLSRKPDIAYILHLRLCWCILLLLVNCQPTPRRLSSTLMDSLAHILAGRPYGRMREPLYRRLEMVKDKASWLPALCETFNHETLVALVRGKRAPRVWENCLNILVVPFTDPVKLADTLQAKLRS
ncbi:hypothetical protein FRC09_001956 [Ceratobasidium sp. 395]|nr:hypothetical protein FRC09_001956 [Ceratobasidium sp. 395]